MISVVYPQKLSLHKPIGIRHPVRLVHILPRRTALLGNHFRDTLATIKETTRAHKLKNGGLQNLKKTSYFHLKLKKILRKRIIRKIKTKAKPVDLNVPRGFTETYRVS